MVGAKPKAVSMSKPTIMFANNPLGIPKENSGINFRILRKVAEFDPVVSNCVTIIKKTVSQSPWKISKRDDVDKIDLKEVKAAYNFFHFVNPDGENFRMLLDRTIEDILQFDAGAIELVYNFKGEVVGMNSVDGTTIRMKINEYGDLDDVATK